MTLPWFITAPNPDIYLGDNYVVVDLETTNREKGSALNGENSLLLACWSLGRDHPELLSGDGAGARNRRHWGDEFSQGSLARAIERADFFVAHGSKFELGWFKRIGIDLRKLLPYCTLIGEKVLAGNRKVLLSLEATATRRGLGHKDAGASLLIKSGVCPSAIPSRMLEQYCAQDVALTEAVFLAQRQELKGLGLLPVAYVRNLTTPALADIEFNGMTLDAGRVNATYAEYAEKYAELEGEFSRLTGGINVKSGPQMAKFIYETLGFAELTDHKGRIVKTPAGRPMTDKETLAKLKATTPEQKAFIKVAKELVKLKTPLQNLTKMHDICKESPDDPRVFATYNQTVVQTDRLSSTGRNGGFQFHNFDRAFKKLFRARRAGWLVCEGDAPQLEFRVAALLGNDEVAKRDIREGVDIHANTASVIGCSRQDAKPRTFRPLYGGNKGTPREQAYFEFFRTRYKGIYETQSGWTVQVARDKKLVNPWGLIFYWPDTEISRTGYITNTTQIFNYPIQSFATADIIPLTLILVWHRVAELGEDKCVLVNTVHDSIIGEVNPDDLDEYKQILIDSFTRDIYPLVEAIYPAMTLDIPLGVGIKAGSHWADGEEEKYEPNISR